MLKFTKIGLILVTIAITGTGCLSRTAPPKTPEEPQDPVGITLKSVTYETNDVKGDQPRCAFNWTYPEPQGPSEIVGNMNQAIALAVGLASNYPVRSSQTVEEAGREFVENCTKEQAELASGLEEDGAPIVPYLSERDFDVKWNQSPVLSLLIRAYEESGGAHGLPSMNAVNLDQRTGKQLLLGDLVKTDSLRPLMKRVNEAFLFQYRDALFPETADEIRDFIADRDGTKSEILASENNFYLTSEGFIFFANVYDLAPYAAGPLSVSLPYSQVKDFLLTDSVLSEFVR